MQSPGGSPVRSIRAASPRRRRLPLPTAAGRSRWIAGEHRWSSRNRPWSAWTSLYRIPRSGLPRRGSGFAGSWHSVPGHGRRPSPSPARWRSRSCRTIARARSPCAETRSDPAPAPANVPDLRTASAEKQRRPARTRAGRSPVRSLPEEFPLSRDRSQASEGRERGGGRSSRAAPRPVRTRPGRPAPEVRKDEDG